MHFKTLKPKEKHNIILILLYTFLALEEKKCFRHGIWNTFHMDTHLSVHLKKEAVNLSWLFTQPPLSQTKAREREYVEGTSGLGWRMEGREDASLSSNLIMKMLNIHLPSFSFFERERGWVNNNGRLIDSFFELTADLPLSLNSLPILLFFQIYSKCTPFFKFTIKCLILA